MAEPQLCNTEVMPMRAPDRKSTRLNSSHTVISYAVFCLKKKNMALRTPRTAEKNRSTRLISRIFLVLVLFFNDTATTEIYTLSLHDALPISSQAQPEPKRLTPASWNLVLKSA